MPLTVVYIVHTYTVTTSGAKDWIEEVSEAIGGQYKGDQEQELALYLA